MKKHTKRASNRTPLIGIIIGTGVALVITFILSLGLTSLTLNGSVSEERNTVYMFAIRLLAVLVGCVVSTALSTLKTLPTVGITAGLYLFVLLALGIVLYDGVFSSVPMGIISIFIGAVIAYLIRLKPQKKRNFNVRVGR